MSATINSMNLVYADLLTPSQLMEDDLIEIEGVIVDVISVIDDATGDNYTVIYRNEYGENDSCTFPYDEKIKLYVFIDEDE